MSGGWQGCRRHAAALAAQAARRASHYAASTSSTAEAGGCGALQRQLRHGSSGSSSTAGGGSWASRAISTSAAPAVELQPEGWEEDQAAEQRTSAASDAAEDTPNHDAAAGIAHPQLVSGPYVCLLLQFPSTGRVSCIVLITPSNSTL